MRWKRGKGEQWNRALDLLGENIGKRGKEGEMEAAGVAKANSGIGPCISGVTRTNREVNNGNERRIRMTRTNREV